MAGGLMRDLEPDLVDEVASNKRITATHPNTAAVLKIASRIGVRAYHATREDSGPGALELAAIRRRGWELRFLNRGMRTA